MPGRGSFAALQWHTPKPLQELEQELNIHPVFLKVLRGWVPYGASPACLVDYWAYSVGGWGVGFGRTGFSIGDTR